MNKTMSWSGERVLVSNGCTCSLLSLGMERSRDFATSGVSALSPDGTLVVARELDEVVRVRRVVQREWRAGAVVFACQHLPAAAVLGFAWSAGGMHLAVQLADGTTHTYQVQAGRNGRPGRHLASYRLSAPLSCPSPMAFAPLGNRIALAATAGVILWQARTGDTLRCAGRGQIRSVAWSPNGQYLALGGKDSTVEIYRAGRTLRPVRAWTGHTAAVTCLAWSPDGRRIASGDQDGNVLYWVTGGDASTWGPLGPGVSLLGAGVAALTWSPDGKEVVVVDDQDQLEFLDGRHEGADLCSLAERTSSSSRC